MKRYTITSLLLVLAYVSFFAWYTSFSGPLTATEIEHYLELARRNGSGSEGLEELRRFMESDTGDDFVMVNAIELREPPTRVEGVGADESATEVLGRYMEYMWPALLRRACHPVLGGSAAAPALDIWGIEGANEWSQAGLMRYRSRRDMLEIATNPAFQGRHEFKEAAMLKTIAFPIDPWFHLGDPRLVLGLVTALALLLLRLRAVRRAMLAQPSKSKRKKT